MKKSLKKALAARETLWGTWIQIGHPAIAELLSKAKYDWLAVDCEHTDIDIHNFNSVIRSISQNTSIFARVSENATMPIRLALDSGADGVIIPLVSTQAEAEAAITAAYYPPKGSRGYAYCRANAYGINFDDYAQNANESVSVIVMIETKQAVDNIEEILSVDGIHGVFIGPYDLSGSFGVPGQTNHPTVTKACEKVYSVAASKGKSCGIHLVKPSKENLRHAISNGCNFIALGMDTVFIEQNAKNTLDLVTEVIGNS